jgi:hypothetical protein
MADKKKFNEVEDEVVDDEVEVKVYDTEAEEEPEIAVETKKPNGFIEGCKKVGRIAEGALAIFGGLTAGLMIYDGVKTRKARKNYIPAQPQPQITQSTSQEVLNDVKVETF